MYKHNNLFVARKKNKNNNETERLWVFHSLLGSNNFDQLSDDQNFYDSFYDDYLVMMMMVESNEQE